MSFSPRSRIHREKNRLPQAPVRHSVTAICNWNKLRQGVNRNGAVAIRFQTILSPARGDASPAQEFFPPPFEVVDFIVRPEARFPSPARVSQAIRRPRLDQPSPKPGPSPFSAIHALLAIHSCHHASRHNAASRPAP
jgi:hypothetical protein